jgi:hypothetical protein
MAVALNQSQMDASVLLNLGIQVDRATAATPQTTNYALFNVVGGRVAITAILGTVTTILQAAANDMYLTSKATTGSEVSICAAVETNALEAGGFLSITGTAATAMIKANAGSIPLQAIPVVAAVGTIRLYAAASCTGSIKWSIWYVPIDSGAYIEAA